MNNPFGYWPPNAEAYGKYTDSLMCDINPDPKYQTRDEKLTLLERRVQQLENDVTFQQVAIERLEASVEQLKKTEGQ